MSFNLGRTPTIVCINQATVPLGVRFKTLVEAMQAFVDRAFAPVWATPAHLGFAYDFVLGTWALVFLDDADQAGALGYHELTPDGFPLGKVFVKTTLAAGELVSVTASHELAEMLVDPATNLCAVGPDGSTLYAYETADAVEESSFEINGVPMTNFVYPSWFESFRAPGSTRFDQLTLCSQPFQLLSGGYATVLKNGQWSQIFGSEEKAAARAIQDRRGRRTTHRGRRKTRSCGCDLCLANRNRYSAGRGSS